MKFRVRTLSPSNSLIVNAFLDPQGHCFVTATLAKETSLGARRRHAAFWKREVPPKPWLVDRI